MGTLKFKTRYLLYFVPALLIMGGFFVIPFLQTVVYSLYNWDGIAEKAFIGLANYVEIFQLPLFQQSIARVLQFAVIQPAIQVTVGLILAYMLRGQLRGGKFYRSVFFLPVVISSAAVSVMFTVLYDYDFGLFNSLLRMMGLGKWAKPWLSDKSTAFYAVVLVAVWQQLGMIFVVLLSAMQGVSNDLFEAAEIDGANCVQSFFKIAVPSVRPIIKICVILGISSALKNFDYVSILTRGGPAGSSHVPATIMYDKAFVGFRWGLGSAISVVIFLMGFAFTILMNLATRRTEED